MKSWQAFFYAVRLCTNSLQISVLLFCNKQTSQFFSLDAVLEIGTYIFEVPSLTAIATSTYVFSGYSNLIIFNRLFNEEITQRWYYLIFIFSIFNLLTTFFIPIGFHGADGIGEYIYPWITTADSLMIEFGPIERVIHLFLMLYISLSLLSITIHWHVALKLATEVVPEKRFKKWIEWGFIILFVCCALFSTYRLPITELHIFAQQWMKVRFVFEIGMIVGLFLLARRKRI